MNPLPSYPSHELQLRRERNVMTPCSTEGQPLVLFMYTTSLWTKMRAKSIIQTT